MTKLKDYHVTLAHMSNVRDLDLLRELVHTFAQNELPISGQIGGIGRFTHNENGMNPFYTSLDAPSLPGFRERLVAKLSQYGFKVSKRHGFIPHCTMAYIPTNAPTPTFVVPYTGITFDCVWSVYKDDRERFSLTSTVTQLKERLGAKTKALRQVFSYANT